MLPMTSNASRSVDYDDKWAKASLKSGDSSFSKYREAFSLLTLPGITDKTIAKLFQNSFLVYIAFLIAGSVVYELLGGSFSNASIQELLGYASIVVEAFGLLSLRHKINQQGSVKGISGMTICMYAIVYSMRVLVMMPPFSWAALDAWAVEVLSFVSVLMVYDILRKVFWTFRSTYQEEQDGMRIGLLILGCLVAAALLHPDLQEGSLYSFCWTSCFYLDVMALMPQLVMMAKGGGKVEAPIAHFVAATALSRSVDLWYWYWSFDLVRPRNPGDFNFSAWIIIFFHVLHLALVGDFMYYYLKARISGSSLSADLALFPEDMI